MILVVDPELTERVVFEATRRDPVLSRRYHREFSQCHCEHDGEARDRAFHALHESWFTELGFRATLLSLIGEFPFVRTRLQRVVFGSLQTRRTEGVELFGKDRYLTVVANTTPSLLLDKAAFMIWARHEFQHIDDMLDPAFRFDPSDCPTGSTTAAANRIRDRYAVIWSASIDARLQVVGKAHPMARDRRFAELVRAFGLDSQTGLDAALAGLWKELGATRPTHGTMLAWAREGLPGIGSGDSSTQHRRVFAAGAPCPLCRFATYDWAEPGAISGQVLGAITADYSDWKEADGICGQCAELYRSRSHETCSTGAGLHDHLSAVPRR